MKIFGVDPGTSESGYVVYDTETEDIISFGKIDNDALLKIIVENPDEADVMAIEIITSYGQRVGKETFQTCFFIGKCMQGFRKKHYRIKRVDEKKYICGTGAAKDSGIRQELLDRFEPDLIAGKRPKGKLKGFKADIYSALAVAITCEEQYLKTQRMKTPIQTEDELVENLMKLWNELCGPPPSGSSHPAGEFFRSEKKLTNIEIGDLGTALEKFNGETGVFFSDGLLNIYYSLHPVTKSDRIEGRVM